MASSIIDSLWWHNLYEIMRSAIDPSWWNYLKEVMGSPFTVLTAGAFAIYLIFRTRVNTYEDSDDDDFPEIKKPELSVVGKDMDLKELNLYNSKREDGRFLVSLMGCIFDVSSAPDNFGPEGVYETLSGTNITDHIYHLADEYGISATDHVNEWYEQLDRNFPIVGALLDSKADNDEQNKGDANNSATPKTENLDNDNETFDFDDYNDTPYSINDDDDVTITEVA